jgi:hypothetical protein
VPQALTRRWPNIPRSTDREQIAEREAQQKNRGKTQKYFFCSCCCLQIQMKNRVVFCKAFDNRLWCFSAIKNTLSMQES